MKNYEEFEQAITPEDEDALKFITDISYDPLLDELGSFKLDFHFAENPYFTNKVLSKTYHMVIDAGDAICDSIDATAIDWKPAKDLSKESKEKGYTLGEGGSFFLFFTPPSLPEKGEKDEEEEEQIRTDFNLAAILKDNIIHNAILWFTGDIFTKDGANIFSFNEDEYDSAEDGDFEPDDDEEDQKPPEECKQQ